jgi:hypothetical protein
MRALGAEGVATVGSERYESDPGSRPRSHQRQALAASERVSRRHIRPGRTDQHGPKGI